MNINNLTEHMLLISQHIVIYSSSYNVMWTIVYIGEVIISAI